MKFEEDGNKKKYFCFRDYNNVKIFITLTNVEMIQSIGIRTPPFTCVRI